MNKRADEIIKKFNLKKHPEGGFFSELYRSEEKFTEELPLRYKGQHVFYTSIYFLLKENDISAFHVLKSDEIWHFYEGTTLLIHYISGNKAETVKLGRDYEKGEVYQYLVKAGTYFCAEVEDKNSFVLAGCTVSPGFEYNDFELCRRDVLTNLFPEHKELIEKFTRSN